MISIKRCDVKSKITRRQKLFIYWQHYFEKWGLNLNENEFFDFWFGAEKEVGEMVELCKIIKEKGVKIFILSNNFAERASYYNEQFGFLKTLIDRVYYSWQTGFIKPDERAYKKVLADNNFKPDEVLYFDDSKDNVEVANSLGIKSYLFDGIESVKEILKTNKII